MSRIVANALKDIYFRIPKEALNLAFKIDGMSLGNVSMDERILSSIIRPRVLKDCSLLIGRRVIVKMNECKIFTPNNRFYIIEVPLELTDNKEITEALSIVNSNSYNTPYGTNRGLSRDFERMGAAAGNSSLVSSSDMEVIGKNLIVVNTNMTTFVDCDLAIEVSNSKDLSEFGREAFIEFSQLCYRAVRAYIYNKLNIYLDNGQIVSGHSMGKIKDYVESCSDDDELYLEHLKTKWSVINFSQDSSRLDEFISQYF